MEFSFSSIGYWNREAFSAEYEEMMAVLRHENELEYSMEKSEEESMQNKING